MGFATATFITVAYFAGPSLNFADFTRNAPTEASVRKGNRLGLLINAIAFGVISVIIALASVKVYGEAVHDPIALLGDIDNVTLLLVAIIAVSLATAGINIILNFVSPALDFSNAWPRRISFRTGGLLTAVLALLVMPWKLYANPVAVNYFIGGVGALMGPLLGIMLVDYYLVRRGAVDVHALYSENPEGPYFYNSGFSKRSLICLVVSGVAALAVAYLPALSSLAHFSWPIGLVVGGALCYALNRSEQPVLAPDRRVPAGMHPTPAEELG
jgi:NCS1 family nucleobase:cation symporter-1